MAEFEEIMAAAEVFNDLDQDVVDAFANMKPPTEVVQFRRVKVNGNYYLRAEDVIKCLEIAGNTETADHLRRTLDG